MRDYSIDNPPSIGIAGGLGCLSQACPVNSKWLLRWYTLKIVNIKWATPLLHARSERQQAWSIIDATGYMYVRDHHLPPALCLLPHPSPIWDLYLLSPHTYLSLIHFSLVCCLCCSYIVMLHIMLYVPLCSSERETREGTSLV